MYIPKLTHYLSADFEKLINGKSSLSNSDIPVISEIIGLIYENSNDAAFTLMNLFTFSSAQLFGHETVKKFV